jgi:hypothetical protein
MIKGEDERMIKMIMTRKGKLFHDALDLQVFKFLIPYLETLNII